MTGIDRPINVLLNSFNQRLWPAVDKKKFYGRVFRNNKKGVVIPEVLIEGTKEYEEVMFDSGLNALCFFDAVGNVNNLSEVPTQEVRVVFSVNLKAIYPLLDHRATEEAHKDVIAQIKRFGVTSYQLDRIETGLNAYGDLSTDKLKSYNMQPFYAFAIVMNVPFSYECQI
jgi:hypothetical protein